MAKQALEEKQAELDVAGKTQEEYNDIQKEVDELTEAYADAKDSVKALSDELDNIKSPDFFEDLLLQDFSNRVDGIVSDADALRNAAELIGEGFLVAKEDAQEFAKIYPELLDQAEVLADGSIRLDQATVQAVLNGNTEVLNSNKQVIEEQLEDKIALLEAEIHFQENKLQILQSLLSGEINETEAEERLRFATAQYKEELTNQFGQDFAESVAQNLTNAESEAQGILQALTAVQNAIAQVSSDHAHM